MRPIVERLLGKGIVWAEGDDHKRMAKALSGCFTQERVRGMQDIVVESAAKVSEGSRVLWGFCACLGADVYGALRLSGLAAFGSCLLLYAPMSSQNKKQPLRIKNPTKAPCSTSLGGLHVLREFTFISFFFLSWNFSAKPARLTSYSALETGWILSVELCVSTYELPCHLHQSKTFCVSIYYLIQGIDHDFECGESAEAKDIFRLWNDNVELGITFAGFLVSFVLKLSQSLLLGCLNAHRNPCSKYGM